MMVRMKKIILILLTIAPAALPAQYNFVPSSLILQLGKGTDPLSVSAALSAALTDSLIKPAGVLSELFNVHLFSCSPGREQTAVRQASRLAGVQAAQLNHRIELREKPPDDPLFYLQWAFKNTGQNGGTPGADIGATAAWKLNTGGNTAQGDEIVVAVIDEGFQLDHPDLEDVFFRNHGEIPGNGTDDDGNGYIDDYRGWNAYANNGTMPASSHGTHVCGIIAARGNNARGVTGINWNLKILPVAGSSENEARVIAAYGYVAALRAQYNASGGRRGAFVVATNASFGVNQGKPEEFPIWCAIYDSLGKYGILNAAATTNSNINVDINGDIPTACPSAYLLGVTNSTNTDEKNQSAGFGEKHIDLAAPGTAIYSTNGGSAYGYRTGTSMASPMVAGAIGLMHAAACGEFIEQYRQNPAQTALKMRNMLLDGAERLSAFNGYVGEGRRLNLEKPLQLLNAIPCDHRLKPRAAFTSEITRLCPGDSLRFFNRSSASAKKFIWSFPGGSPAGSELPDLTVKYSVPGIFPVRLVAYNDESADTMEAKNWVIVSTNESCKAIDPPKPRASFTAVSTNICSGAPLQLINTSSNAQFFTWVTAGLSTPNEPNPALEVEMDGEIPIRLIASDGIQADTLDTTLAITLVNRREKPLLGWLGNKLYTLSQGPLQWYFNGNPVEGNSGNFIIPQKAGYYSVTVTNVWGCSSSSDPWLFGFTGEDQVAGKNSFRVGPVPAGSRLTIIAPDQRRYLIELTDLQGKVLLRGEKWLSGQETLDLSGIDNGIYFLRISSSAAIPPEIFRIIKQVDER